MGHGILGRVYWGTVYWSWYIGARYIGAGISGWAILVCYCTSYPNRANPVMPTSRYEEVVKNIDTPITAENIKLWVNEHKNPGGNSRANVGLPALVRVTFDTEHVSGEMCQILFGRIVTDL